MAERRSWAQRYLAVLPPAIAVWAVTLVPYVVFALGPTIAIRVIALVAGLFVTLLNLLLAAAAIFRGRPLVATGPAHRRAALLGLAVLAGVMAIGIIRWPSAPLRRDQGVIVDKQGNRYSEHSLMQFSSWETAMLSAGALAFVGASLDVLGRVTHKLS